ncbi:expressed protein [Echinococcus multilocularis]|uniref:Expressed protein n=1 Tax=Echinococcus multilocularis TaxID=6211 RepID=A0A0S4MLY4_ECHMU|nr:expressed protein [Echinococcus multilocularis]
MPHTRHSFTPNSDNLFVVENAIAIHGTLHIVPFTVATINENGRDTFQWRFVAEPPNEKEEDGLLNGTDISSTVMPFGTEESIGEVTTPSWGEEGIITAMNCTQRYCWTLAEVGDRVSMRVFTREPYVRVNPPENPRCNTSTSVCVWVDGTLSLSMQLAAMPHTRHSFTPNSDNLFVVENAIAIHGTLHIVPFTVATINENGRDTFQWRFVAEPPNEKEEDGLLNGTDISSTVMPFGTEESIGESVNPPENPRCNTSTSVCVWVHGTLSLSMRLAVMPHTRHSFTPNSDNLFADKNNIVIHGTLPIVPFTVVTMNEKGHATFQWRFVAEPPNEKEEDGLLNGTDISSTVMPFGTEESIGEVTTPSWGEEGIITAMNCTQRYCWTLAEVGDRVSMRVFTREPYVRVNPPENPRCNTSTSVCVWVDGTLSLSMQLAAMPHTRHSFTPNSDNLFVVENAIAIHGTLHIVPFTVATINENGRDTFQWRFVAEPPNEKEEDGLLNGTDISSTVMPFGTEESIGEVTTPSWGEEGIMRIGEDEEQLCNATPLLQSVNPPENPRCNTSTSVCVWVHDKNNIVIHGTLPIVPFTVVTMNEKGHATFQWRFVAEPPNEKEEDGLLNGTDISSTVMPFGTEESIGEVTTPSWGEEGIMRIGEDEEQLCNATPLLQRVNPPENPRCNTSTSVCVWVHDKNNIVIHGHATFQWRFVAEPPNEKEEDGLLNGTDISSTVMPFGTEESIGEVTTPSWGEEGIITAMNCTQRYCWTLAEVGDRVSMRVFTREPYVRVNPPENPRCNTSTSVCVWVDGTLSLSMQLAAMPHTRHSFTPNSDNLFVVENAIAIHGTLHIVPFTVATINENGRDTFQWRFVAEPPNEKEEDGLLNGTDISSTIMPFGTEESIGDMTTPPPVWSTSPPIYPGSHLISFTPIPTINHFFTTLSPTLPGLACNRTITSMHCGPWTCRKLAYVGDCVEMIVDFYSAVKLVSPPEDPHCDAARRVCVWLISNTRIEINGTLSQVPFNVTVTRGPSMGEFIFKFMDKEYNHDDNDDDDWGTAGPNSQFKTTSTAVTMTAAKCFFLTLFVLELFR